MIEQVHSFFSHTDSMTVLEVTAVITAIIYVILAAKEKAICFFFAFISSSIYIYICYHYKLYFDTIISIYYVVMAVVGWFMWKKKESGTDTGINSAGKRKMIMLCIIGVISVVITGAFAACYTDASLPFVDSFTTVFAIIATVMVVRKEIENWILLAVVDAVSIGMYFYKGLFFTSLLYLLYTIIAINGYIIWKRKMKIQNISST